jgi:serine/threonine-protein kinase SRPK3
MFELIVGQSPFTGLMSKKGDVVQQMVDTIGELPAKWQFSFDAMPKLGQY